MASGALRPATGGRASVRPDFQASSQGITPLGHYSHDSTTHAPNTALTSAAEHHTQSTATRKSAGHGPCTGLAQSLNSAYSATAREQPEGTAHGGESSDDESGTARQWRRHAREGTKAAACRHDAKQNGTCERLDAHDASTRVTCACTEAAALPTSQMKHCV